MVQGVIVGSDQTQEWLLPWWWGHYQTHNHHPVVFFDFGLSDSMKQWCRQKGQLISLPPFFAKEKEEVEPSIAAEWESRYGENFWASRHSWFKKPLACLHSPFQKSIWVDLDCEILGSLIPLFDACDHPSGVALAKDQSVPTYNSGVIAFRKNTPLIQEWAAQSLLKNALFRGDQDLLSHILQKQPICELPPIYNWNVGYGLNPQVVIYHWVGERGKATLRDQLILKDL